MIEKYNEYIKEIYSSNSNITVEMVHEVVYYRCFSMYDFENSDIFDKIDKFYKFFDFYIDDIGPLDKHGYDRVCNTMDKIFEICLENDNYGKMLKELYDLVRKEMEGFPLFHKLENLFVLLMDEEWNVFYEYNLQKNMKVILRKYNSDIMEYASIINKCLNMVKRIPLITKKKYKIVNSKYDIDDDNDSESIITIALY
jgi:hypothetical protein